MEVHFFNIKNIMKK